jgi:hypothetical protein
MLALCCLRMNQRLKFSQFRNPSHAFILNGEVDTVVPSVPNAVLVVASFALGVVLARYQWLGYLKI